MSEDLDEKLEEHNPDTAPVEVIIKNKDKKEGSIYDSKDDEEYDDLAITEEEVKEFNDRTSSK